MANPFSVPRLTQRVPASPVGRGFARTPIAVDSVIGPCSRRPHSECNWRVPGDAGAWPATGPAAHTVVAATLRAPSNSERLIPSTRILRSEESRRMSTLRWRDPALQDAHCSDDRAQAFNSGLEPWGWPPTARPYPFRHSLAVSKLFSASLTPTAPLDLTATVDMGTGGSCSSGSGTAV